MVANPAKKTQERVVACALATIKPENGMVSTVDERHRRTRIKQSRVLVDEGVVATIVNAKTVWTVGKLVASITDEATKAADEAIKKDEGATDAQLVQTVERVKVAQAQAREVEKKLKNWR